jgi:hypothetical protein
MAEYNATTVDNEVFTSFIKAQTVGKKPSGSPTREYKDPIRDNKWVGLVPNEYKIIRVVSAPPANIPTLAVRPEDVIEVIRAEVKDDNGKWFPIIYPVIAEDLDHSHILHRFIAKVLEVEWSKTEKGKKTYKNLGKYPDLVDRVEHGQWTTSDRQRQYSKGFKGQQMTIMNVIDRSDMQWHRDNLKMKLLSKSVALGKDGVSEFVTMGVPTWGFIKAFADVLESYGNWARYDVAIKRTGDKTTPYVIKNASRKKLKDDLDDIKGIDPEIISIDDHLTDEELSWELVNLQEQFAATSFFQLKNRLGKLFLECDNCLGTKFIPELEASVEKESSEWKLAHSSDYDLEDSEPAAEPNTEPVREAAPVNLRSTEKVVHRETIGEQVNTALSPEQTATLKGYSKLTDVEKSWIKDIVLKADGSLDHVEYSVEAGEQAECPDCRVASPLKFAHCPGCGAAFTS